MTSRDIISKLPKGEQSIFAVMSELAAKHKSIDVSQGFPNFETDEHLKKLAATSIHDGNNQYAPMRGILELRVEIAKKIESLYHKKYDGDSEILLTNGATQALNAAITAFVHKGDEVIIFKPAYDSYEPSVKICGGVPVLIQLSEEDFSINWEEVSAKISSKTRMIILNTPHNPTGTMVSKDDMLILEKLLEPTNIILLSDEVYEHIVFDDNKHYSASNFPRLAERSIICASFGKTFHNTGWKTGYCVAPKYLMDEIVKIHQVNVFCINRPMQHAFAEYLKNPDTYLKLGVFYQKKRDAFLKYLKPDKFKISPSQGTYFQTLNYGEVSNLPDVDLAKLLVEKYQLATIPISVFNLNQIDNFQLRICFAKTDETLKKAATILNSIEL